MLKHISISLQNDTELLDLGRALSSPQRLDILKQLYTSSMNVKELATILNYPLSTTSLNVDILEKCKLICTETQYNMSGKSKLCSRNCDTLTINLFEPYVIKNNQISFNICIGCYSSYSVKSTCGLATPTHTIGQDNDEDNFFDPLRFEAKLLWFSSGYVEYRVSRKNLPKNLKSLEISFEACSEAPFYRNDWKSDITLWLNDIEAGTWISPGDFGGRQGKQNPDWWSPSFTQYGILNNWLISSEGTFMNNSKMSEITLNDVNIEKCPYISFKIGVKEDAHNRGGINLFGSSFGDYAQDIIVKATW